MTTRRPRSTPLDEEFDNVEAAFEWSAADADRAALALGPIQALYDFWLARGTRRAQGVHWSLAITDAAISVPPAVRVRAMAQANVIIGQSDLAAAARVAEAARSLASTVPTDERAALYAAIATLLDRRGQRGPPGPCPARRRAGAGTRRPGPPLDRRHPQQLPGDDR